MSRPPFLPSDGLLPDPYGAHEMPIYLHTSSAFAHHRAPRWVKARNASPC